MTLHDIAGSADFHCSELSYGQFGSKDNLSLEPLLMAEHPVQYMSDVRNKAASRLF